MPDTLQAVDETLRRIEAEKSSAGGAMETLIGSHIALRNHVASK